MNDILDLEFVTRLLKFGMVGAFCFVIDFGLTYFSKEKMRINKFIANSFGFCVSVICNFTLNRIWTFHSVSKDIELQFVKFIAIASFGLILSTILIYLLNEKIRMNFYLSKMVAVFIVMFYNYSMNSYFTFTNMVSP